MSKSLFVMILTIGISCFGCSNSSGGSDDDTNDNVSDDSSGNSNDDDSASSDHDADANDNNTDNESDTTKNDNDDQVVMFDSEMSEVCDEADMGLNPVPGRIMILLDMSSSMLEGTPSKLEQAITALTNVLSVVEGQNVEIGLDLFPDGSQDPSGSTRCGVNNEVLIDCDFNNEQDIIAELNISHITGATPLYCAMNNFTNPDYAPGYSSNQANNILIAVTDGSDNCFTDCQEMTQLSSNRAFGDLSAELCANHGIRTVTVGFGEEADEGQLNAVAENGCTEYTSYLQADDQEELENALLLLAGLAIKCSFSIGTLDEMVDPTLVNVYFDGNVVPYDANCQAGKGWRWKDDTYREIEFCSEACDTLQTAKNVNAKFGCRTVEIIFE